MLQLKRTINKNDEFLELMKIHVVGHNYEYFLGKKQNTPMGYFGGKLLNINEFL